MPDNKLMTTSLSLLFPSVLHGLQLCACARTACLAVLAAFMYLPGTVRAGDEESSSSVVKTQINWAEFLKSRDMIWRKAPNHWDNAPFTGNGFMGMHIKMDPVEKGRLRVDVARMDAQEHLPMDNPQDGLGDWSYKRYRMPLGYFFLDFKEELKDWNLRLDLWNAEITGVVKTTGGEGLYPCHTASDCSGA